MRCIEIGEATGRRCVGAPINRNMRCIEIRNPCAVIPEHCMINRNMRCIEISIVHTRVPVHSRLIETWDVLKSNYTDGLPSKIG